MEKYIIRQEYFGASMLDTQKLQLSFLEHRETDMLKMLQSDSLDNAVNRMIRSVDSSIANDVLNHMLSFVDSQKKSGVINSDNTPNYTLRQMSEVDLLNLPRESLKAPLKINLNLEDDLMYTGSKAVNTNGVDSDNRTLSDSELYKIFQESRNADVLEFVFNSKKGSDMKSYQAYALSECAKDFGLVTTINYNGSTNRSLETLKNPETRKIIFDLDLENCVKELNITSTGEASFYCPGSNKLIPLGNIRSFDYSVAKLWDTYRDKASLCNSSDVVPREVWRD